MIRQDVLPISAPHTPTFENFVVGGSSELLQSLQAQHAGFRGYWLCGENVCGKTHLLIGSCMAAAEEGYLQAYIDCAEMGSRQFIESVTGLTERIRIGVDLGGTVAIDHAAALQSERAVEEALMALYNAINDGQLTVPRRLLIAHRQTAATLEFTLPDLNSRLRALAHHRLEPLNDTEKSQVLRLRCEQSGYRLDDAVLEYWLRRGPRGLDQLLADLQRLDQATLQHKRMLTIPLLKSVLGY